MEVEPIVDVIRGSPQEKLAMQLVNAWNEGQPITSRRSPHDSPIFPNFEVTNESPYRLNLAVNS